MKRTYRKGCGSICFISRQRAEDAVKFILQAMLGVGHLLASREGTEEGIAREMGRVEADREEPLYEILSPAWARLNLRRALAEQIRPGTLAGMMLAAGRTDFTREDVAGLCLRVVPDGGESRKEAEFERIHDRNWLPSHSEAYREAYNPAYRVISSEWIPCMEAYQAIERKRGTIGASGYADGPLHIRAVHAGAEAGERVPGGSHAYRRFVIPHALKTPGRLAVPGGNCDAERLAGEAAAPFKEGRPVRYRRYDCMNDCLLPSETLPETRVLILEGSYCNLPAIRKFADIRLFLDAPREIRERRLARRESAASLRQFHEKWIPLEDAYFSAYRLPDEGCVVIGQGIWYNDQ